MRDIFVSGIDIGSAGIRCAVGQKGGTAPDILHIIGLAEVPSEGVFKGVITSIDDAVSALTACLEKTERMIGAPIEHALVGISGPSIIAQPSKGVVAVSRADKEIREDDVTRVIEAAQAIATPPNYEILHILPRTFTIDNQSGIKDPIGMTGIRLEVEAQIVQGLSSQINTFMKAVHRTGIEIDDVVLGPLACAEGILSRRQKELGVALINLGATTTSLVVFQEGDLVHARVFPVGSGHVTSDIAIGLRIPLDLAEKIKVEYGVASASQVSKKEEVSLEELSGEEGKFSSKYLAEIIEARLEEIFGLVDREFKKMGVSGLLPFGVVLTGGGAKTEGIVEVAKKSLRLPASIGLPQSLSSAIDRVSDPIFSTAVGLVAWAKEIQVQTKKTRTVGLTGVENLFKRWFKALMP